MQIKALLNISKKLFQANKFFISSSPKICYSAEEAIADVKDGDTILVGGFSLVGAPQTLIRAVKDKGVKDLTVGSINAGNDDFGVGLLFHNKQVKKFITTHLAGNQHVENLYINGELEIEFNPMGTLAERIRAAGAGIPGFYTKTGAGTLVHKGGVPVLNQLGSKGKKVAKFSKAKESRKINGKDYILEEALPGDIGLIQAQKADTQGNLQYRYSQQNINPDIATACKKVIVEVEEIVEPGQLDPNFIHTPSVYVDKILKVDKLEKKFEILKFYEPENENKKLSHAELVREKIAKRACLEFKNGMYVNLGIGIPTLIPNFLPSDVKITLHGENGILGMGRFPMKGEEDVDLINATRELITLVPGTSAFSSSISFSMIRGCHLDLTVLGGMQVAKNGDLANWIVPGQKIKGMGGAMDLVSSGSKVVICMEHTNKGKPKIIDKCTIPITGAKCVDTLITELAVFKMRDGELVLTEVAKETSLDKVLSQTGFKPKIADDLKEF